MGDVKNMIKVAAAIIEDADGRILIARRAQGKSQRRPDYGSFQGASWRQTLAYSVFAQKRIWKQEIYILSDAKQVSHGINHS